MCVQCMAGAMRAAAGATGALSATLIVAGVIASGLIGPTTS
jgi:hypothetical protein